MWWSHSAAVDEQWLGAERGRGGALSHPSSVGFRFSRLLAHISTRDSLSGEAENQHAADWPLSRNLVFHTNHVFTIF